MIRFGAVFLVVAVVCMGVVVACQPAIPVVGPPTNGFWSGIADEAPIYSYPDSRVEITVRAANPDE